WFALPIVLTKTLPPNAPPEARHRCVRWGDGVAGGVESAARLFRPEGSQGPPRGVPQTPPRGVAGDDGSADGQRMARLYALPASGRSARGLSSVRRFRGLQRRNESPRSE